MFKFQQDHTRLMGTVLGWALWGFRFFLTRNHIHEPILIFADLQFVYLIDFNLFENLLNRFKFLGAQTHPDKMIGGDSIST